MKIKALIVAGIMFLFATTSYAVNIGISLTGVSLDADGKETHGSAQKRDETLEAAVGSVFFETGDIAIGSLAINFGLDYIPYDIESETVSNYQIDSDNNNTANVTIADHYTVYGMVGLGDSPAFVKLAYSEADLLTDENISNMQTAASTTRTNSTYPNSTLKGYHLSIGADVEAGPVTVRAEVGASDYDEVKVNSSSGGNTVTVNADGTFARLSIVKSF